MKIIEKRMTRDEMENTFRNVWMFLYDTVENDTGYVLEATVFCIGDKYEEIDMFEKYKISHCDLRYKFEHSNPELLIGGPTYVY